MAIFHLTAKTGTRGNGQSAVAKYNYVCRESKYANHKDKLVFARSGNMPEWAKEKPKAYWNASDKFERANGRLFKEIEFALPRELSAKKQKSLALDFAKSITEKDNLPYTLAIHEGKGTNPHCHLVVSERKNDKVNRPAKEWFRRANKKEPEKGGAVKSTSLMPKEWLLNIREEWARRANHELKRQGFSEEIDHRSHKERGIQKIPGIHVGANIACMEEKGIRTRKAEKVLKIERVNYERDRQDKIRKEQGRTSRELRADSNEFSDYSRGYFAKNARVEKTNKFFRKFSKVFAKRFNDTRRDLQKNAREILNNHCQRISGIRITNANYLANYARYIKENNRRIQENNRRRREQLQARDLEINRKKSIEFAKERERQDIQKAQSDRKIKDRRTGNNREITKLDRLDKEKALELSDQVGLQSSKGDKLKSHDSKIPFKEDTDNLYQAKQAKEKLITKMVKAYDVTKLENVNNPEQAKIAQEELVALLKTDNSFFEAMKLSYEKSLKRGMSL